MASFFLYFVITLFLPFNKLLKYYRCLSWTDWKKDFHAFWCIVRRTWNALCPIWEFRSTEGGPFGSYLVNLSLSFYLWVAAFVLLEMSLWHLTIVCFDLIEFYYGLVWITLLVIKIKSGYLTTSCKIFVHSFKLALLDNEKPTTLGFYFLYFCCLRS